MPKALMMRRDGGERARIRRVSDGAQAAGEAILRRCVRPKKVAPLLGAQLLERAHELQRRTVDHDRSHISAIAIQAPSPAKLCTVAWPMPPAPPVMATILTACLPDMCQRLRGDTGRADSKIY